MRIGIYARSMIDNFGGVRKYIESMTYEISKNLEINDELYVIHNNDTNYFKIKRPNFHEVILKSKNKVICDYVLAPTKINKLDLDVIWFPHNVIPFFIKGKKVVSVLDLAYYMKKINTYKFIDTVYMKIMIKNSCKRADKIISISNNTKEDLVKILGVNSEKITTVYLSSDDIYKRITDIGRLNKIKKKYGLKNEFILNTGAIIPRKNIYRLISAFKKIQNTIDYDLVLTGKNSYKQDKTEKLIKTNKRVIRLGYVDEEDLPCLYNLASVYVYPSLYEGFGIPILEAQSCGCPVVTSNKSCLPEISGNGAVFINPYNTEDIVKSILRIINNSDLRKKLISEGYKNKKKFNWNKSAKKVIEIIKSA